MNTLWQRSRAWIDRRLERRIAVYFVMAIFSVSLLFGAGSLATTLWIVWEHQFVENEQQLNHFAALLGEKIAVFAKHTRDLAKNPLMVNALLDSPGRQAYLQPFLAHYRFPLNTPHSLSLCDFEGNPLAEQQAFPVGCLADLPESQAVIENEQPQARFILLEQKPSLALFEPVFFPGTGRAEGYILTALDLQTLVVQYNPFESKATLALLSDEGHVQFAVRANTVIAVPAMTDSWVVRCQLTNELLVAMSLTLVLDRPIDEITALAPLLAGYGLGTLALAVMALALAYRLARRIAQPLLTLNGMARRIARQGPVAGLAVMERYDEIGQLATSFNRMVTALREAQFELEDQVRTRTEQLAQALVQVESSEKQIRAILDSVPYQIAVLNHDGVIQAINEPWQRFAQENGIQQQQLAQRVGVGVNYLEVCEAAMDAGSTEAITALRGIQAVLSGQQPRFAFEYPCHAPHAEHWFIMRVTPLHLESGGVVIAHTEITDRYRLEQERRKLSQAVEQSPVSIVITNLEGNLEYVNRQFLEVTGYALEEALGQNPRILKSGDTLPETYKELWNTITNGQIWRGILRNRKKNGDFYWESAQISPLYDEQGRIAHYLGIKEDITARKIAEDALRVSLANIKRHDAQMMILNQMSDALLACKTYEHAYAIIADNAERLFAGCSGGVAVMDTRMATPVLRVMATWGHSNVLPATFPPQDCRALRHGQCYEAVDSARHHRCRHFSGPPDSACLCIPLIIQKQTIGLLHISVSAEWEGSFEELRTLAIAVGEATKQTLSNLQLQEILREQALHDPLTGLFNRRYLDETLPRELSRYQRSNEPLVIAMLDVDHFKNFNDDYGHEAGDIVLQAIGDLLIRTLRAGDLPCRYGGEEFTLILHASTLEDALPRLEQLRQAIMRLHLHYRRGELPAVTASIGAVAARPEETDAAALLGRADAALYQAKEQGRNRVVMVSRYPPDSLTVIM